MVVHLIHVGIVHVGVVHVGIGFVDNVVYIKQLITLQL